MGIPDTDHSKRLFGMSKSTAMVGKPTVVMPLSKVLILVTRVTDVMITAVVAFEVVSVLSSERKEATSLGVSFAMVEGRLILAGFKATA